MAQMLALQRRPMAVLSLAHLCDDVNQSYLAALLPFIVIERHLNLHSAALLVLAANIASSFVQPLIGMLADRFALAWLVPIGMWLAGAGIAAIGIAPSFPLMILAAVISGLGVALFHPEGARMANLISGSQKGRGMRWFSAGGNLGFAIGPAFAGVSIGIFGLAGTLLAIVPVTVMAAIVALEMPHITARSDDHRIARRDHHSAAIPATGTDRWSAFARLGAFVAVRSMGFIGLVAFVPLYFVRELGTAPTLAATVLALVLTAGAGGTIIGGTLTDRIGRKPMLLYSTGLSALTLLGLVVATPVFHDGVIGLALGIGSFCCLGAFIVSGQASFVVLGQEYLPNRLGLASGVTLGLAVSLGGISSPFLGSLADAHGLRATLAAIAVLVMIAYVIALTLPREVSQSS